MKFTIFTSPLVWGLLLAALVLSLIYCGWQWWRACRLRRFVNDDEARRDYLETLPPVSVIVDACKETDELLNYLPVVLQQAYPTMEVIVVTDGAAETTSGALSELKAQYPFLHFTFVPTDARSLSRKKLALMMGIKAARYDIVLLTNANACPRSDQWLATMMRNFTPGTDVVLGYSHYLYSRDHGVGRRYRTFDTVSTGVQWLVSAIQGHPYRGTNDNLAYRKQLFFDHHGFAQSLDLQWGDDDVFLSEIMGDGSGVRVELDPDAQVETYYDNPPRAHRLLKMRRDFTSRMVRQAPRLMQATMSVVNLLRVLATAAAVALDWRNLVVWAVAAVIAIGSWVWMTLAFRRQCRVLTTPPLRLSVPMFTLWRPIVNAFYRVRERRASHSNYTTYI